MSRKYTQLEINNYFLKHNCIVLSDYINANIKIKIKCNICNNISETRINDFKKLNKCKYCSKNDVKEKLKLPNKYVFNFFKKNNCELLDEYINYDSLLKYKCKCGKISFISFKNFKNGHRCKECGYNKVKKKRTFSQEYVEKYFKDNGCQLLDNYVSSSIKVKYKCSCENVAYIRLNDFKKGQRCKECGTRKQSETISGNGHWRWNPDRKYIKEYKYIKTRYYALLNNLLKRKNIKKFSNSEKILGYSIKEFYLFIKNEKNYKKLKSNFHIDHIIPIKAFFDNKIYDPKIINNLNNLQLLTPKNNMIKNDKYNIEYFNDYLSTYYFSQEGWIC